MKIRQVDLILQKSFRGLLLKKVLNDMNEKYVGPHVSIGGGVENAPLNAYKTGATAFGMFTKNQRQWVAKP